jgi:uncharacterized protein (DUF2147 family)
LARSQTQFAELAAISTVSAAIDRVVDEAGKTWMRRAKPTFACVTGLLMMGMSVPASAQERTPSTDPTGEWLVSKQVARIRIVNCNDRLWGVVAWEARPGGTDSKNPDPQLRSRPTLGMPILLGMTPAKPNEWQGEIYNAEDGRTYSANISLVDSNTLRVQGCVLGFLCGGENWTRVEPQPESPTARRDQRRSNARQPAAAPTDPAAEICSRVAEGSGLTH